MVPVTWGNIFRLEQAKACFTGVRGWVNTRRKRCVTEKRRQMCFQKRGGWMKKEHQEFLHAPHHTHFSPIPSMWDLSAWVTVIPGGQNRLSLCSKVCLSPIFSLPCLLYVCAVSTLIQVGLVVGLFTRAHDYSKRTMVSMKIKTKIITF